MNKHFCFELCSSFLMEKSTPADAKGESCIFFGFLIIFWIEDLKKRGAHSMCPPALEITAFTGMHGNPAAPRVWAISSAQGQAPSSTMK